MKVLIVGAGAVGLSVAKELTKSGHEVSIIDKKNTAMSVSSAPEASWHLADACEIPSLRSAGGEEADILVAATGDDKVNLVVSLLAKTEFGIGRVIARVNNPKNEWLFTDNWGVDVTVSTPQIMTTLVEDAVADGRVTQVLKFHKSGASLWQASISEDAPIIGHTLKDISLPGDVIICAIVRDGVPVKADPDILINSDDHILLLAGEEAGDVQGIEGYFKAEPANNP
ncbi:TrkA family potassium uptake protein [Actinotignum urinale]|uniref:potassium channel family protein n=1 Tax=Actinotignum urinale TaxID=190146 RepID=UPI000C807D0F|nr:TrkA family potassium uptake protein [Actinotignum urinale]WIK59087.1 TrkA family potassium uptake protein [Actinotignum urinale]